MKCFFRLPELAVPVEPCAPAQETLGFSDNQIDCDFLPAMALRNEIDIGHVELGLFKMDQLKTIHAFTERAEGAFRDMFEHLIGRVESGVADIAPHELGPPRDEAIRLVDRLQRLTAEKPKV